MRRVGRIVQALLHRFAALGVAVATTLALFLVLPLIQAIGDGPDDVVALQEYDPANVPPPPEPPPEQEEPEPEEPEQPELEELEDSVPELDLNALASALDGGASLGGAGYLDIGSRLEQMARGGGDLFSLGDLDQDPRCTHQPPPLMNEKLARYAPGQVTVIFVVDERGRVVDPRVEDSTHAGLERAALEAVRKWRFEPGMRGGRPASSRMRIDITFPG